MLEYFFPAAWVERRSWFAFLIGVAYTVIGIFSAMLIFPADTALASIAFTSLLLLPTLNKMFKIESRQAARERKFDLTDPFKNHSDIFQVYLFLFLGVMLTYLFFSYALPSIAGSHLFEAQAELAGVAGSAVNFSDFLSILVNNAVVLFFAFVASFVYGSGSIFIIIWNASAWGVLIGMFAKQALAVSSHNPAAYFGLAFLAISPHLVAEASAYILAALAGGIVSRGLLFEKVFSDRFNKLVKDAFVVFTVAIILLVVSAFVEAFISVRLFDLFGL